MQERVVFLLELGAILALSVSTFAQNATEITLYSFTGGSDGGAPFSVVFGPDGNLYGTTDFAGTVDKSDCLSGCGTTWRLTPASGGSWTFELIHSFTGNSSDFGHPFGRLAFDSSGDVWGTAFEWGPHGFGGVYELAANSWSESLIFSCAFNTGEQPTAGLTSHNGVWYGTTQYGNSEYDDGQVFSLTAGSGGAWNESVVHAFTGKVDGYEPQTNLLIDEEGNIYGSTPYGGPSGSGDIFELSPLAGGKWKEKRIYDFPFYSQGMSYYPSALIFDSKGNLYGTTGFGGTGTCGVDLGCGTVFELQHVGNSWQEVTLYEFLGGSDGQDPSGGLYMDSQGNLWGTTVNGGTGTCASSQFGGCGTVFELTNSNGTWQKTTVYNFTGGTDGAFPDSALVADSAGNLYGTTDSGGPAQAQFGVVFEIQP